MGFAFADLAVPLGVLVICLSSERVRDALFGAMTAESPCTSSRVSMRNVLCAGQLSKVELASCLEWKNRENVEN